MPYLLNLIYLVLLAVCAPWLLYQSLRAGKYRQGFAAKFLGSTPRRRSTATCVWLHAVSVGEVNVLRTLVERLQTEHPEWELAISTTTRTGYELARKRFAEHTVFYCPLDFSWAVRRAMRRVRPGLLVLAELELWPNLVRAAREHGTKIAVVNGRLSDSSARGYGRVRWFVASVLRQVSLIVAQNEQYAERFRSLGAPAERVCVSGSLKFDGAETNRANRVTTRLRELAKLPPSAPVFLAGSTQEPEETLALEAWRAALPDSPELRLVLAPRHPERFESVARALQERGVAFRRRTELDRRPLDDSHRVLLIDVVGELGAWWGLAAVAFVGGSMTGKRGGQNMIEPAAYGAAVCFGPHTHNFRDIVAAFMNADAAQVVSNRVELSCFVRRALTDRAFADALGGRARELVMSQLGATQRTVKLIAALMAESPNETPTELPGPLSSESPGARSQAA